MTTTERLDLVFDELAADIKNLRTTRGTLAALTTADKSSLVLAINELQSEINALGGGGIEINDAASNASTTQTWSVSKIIAELNTLKSQILGGASAAFDTLQELQTAFQGNDSALNNLISAVSKRVAVDQVQTFTIAEKLQACENLGIGNPDFDYLAGYIAARDS